MDQARRIKFFFLTFFGITLFTFFFHLKNRKHRYRLNFVINVMEVEKVNVVNN